MVNLCWIVVEKRCKNKKKTFGLWTQVGAPISLSKRMGQTHFPLCGARLHLLHNEPVTFPALPVPIYTPGSRGVIMVKCLTQGHNTLTVTGLEPTTFCLWNQHWSARPHAPTEGDEGEKRWSDGESWSNGDKRRRLEEGRFKMPIDGCIRRMLLTSGWLNLKGDFKTGLKLTPSRVVVHLYTEI